MKNKRYIVFFIFVLTLIVSVYQFGRRIQSEKIYFRYLKNIKCEYEKQIEKRNSAYYMLKEDIILNFQNNGLPLCLNEIIYEDGTSACHLKDIISDTSLVVRLSQSNCGICVNTLMSLLQKVNILKSATKLFSVLLASKRPLITELADKLRLKYPLLPTISPCPTMRLEAIRSIIPISCRRYPKSV